MVLALGCCASTKPKIKRCLWFRSGERTSPWCGPGNKKMHNLKLGDDVSSQGPENPGHGAENSRIAACSFLQAANELHGKSIAESARSMKQTPATTEL